MLEPDQNEAKTLQRALARADVRFEVAHRTNTESALTEASCAGASYHAIVVSNTLPGTSGLEFFRRLRSAKVTVPTLLLFKSDEEKDAAAALATGADDVLLRDDAGRYLKLVPFLLARQSRIPDRSTTGSPERLAVVVRADPESTAYKTAEHSLSDSEPLWRAPVESPFQYFMLFRAER